MDNQNKSNLAGTQLYLRIAEIRDNTIVLKNGGIRSVLKTSSINFNLKSEEEQNSIIYSYQGFLNSIEFPIQILVKSKKLDLDDYINQVKELGDKQENKLLQDQTYEYAQYIRKIIDYADIMEKNFYVIVPYNPGRSKGDNLIQSFFQRISPKDSFSDIAKRHKEFEDLRKKLTHQTNIVKSGLENCGLKVEELKTDQLIELLYQSYNPKTSQSTKLKDLGLSSIESDEDKIKNTIHLEKEENSSI